MFKCIHYSKYILDAFSDSVILQRTTTVNFPCPKLVEGKFDDKDQLFSSMLIEHALDLMDKNPGKRVARYILGKINVYGQIIQILELRFNKT